MSFSEWREYKLEDVTINYNSKRVPLSSKERELRQGKYPYYGAQGVIDFIDKFIFEGQYLLVAEDGANLETRNEDIARLTKNQEQFWVNNHAHILRSNENSDIRYIKYFLNKSDLSGYITGSAQPKLNKANLNSIRMVLPPLEEQKAIAHILSTLDDKIEVNNQINRTLENMAQTIFKQWFVDFEFPNEDGEPYKSSGGEMVESELGMIPKGWEVVQIDSLCRHIKPGTNYQPKRIDLGIPFLNVRNINKGHIDVTDVKYISKEDFENVHKSWVPEENDVLISRIGTLGLVAVIRKRDLPIAVHYNFINFKTKDVSFQFFYFTLKSDFFQSQYHGIKKASVQEYVTLDEVKKLKLVFPTNREIFKNFEKKFIDMYELINNKQEETESLIKIRDSLLPKLMSGEIRVPLNEEGDVS
ncbi:restriction endonuclease subunit S [Enterococcus saccharolyticus]|uniref:Type I restriction modification DNA specificity domain-containing protein n=1 Tax=Enterococcus saccharolyticus subsp. saccharolyticus ATCC 43076 TaxID=1139996 RepID=S0J8G0_9ENTE|nr:restriction endonuclease subunit S [Enterococcus saccharolyticus]EOT29209.1 hypothetical protein OMQ_01161 [Enterococcus saccharolyticus subsp. saccharolyticus ATCC 43076]EOT81008.1 hypothetical protein I572_01540 [Enterococcus saccharolyticus subsp. saccharolyticus ATCC 43076]